MPNYFWSTRLYWILNWVFVLFPNADNNYLFLNYPRGLRPIFSIFKWFQLFIISYQTIIKLMTSSQSHFPCMNCFFYVFKCSKLCFAIFPQFMKVFLFSFWPKPYARDPCAHTPYSTWDGAFLVGKAGSDPSSIPHLPTCFLQTSLEPLSAGSSGKQCWARVKNANSTSTN